MIVRVIKRDGWAMSIVYVQIADKCPVCGGERGKPYNHRFCEDGEWFDCDRWDNPCGHIDKYKNVLEEANCGRKL